MYWLPIHTRRDAMKLRTIAVFSLIMALALLLPIWAQSTSAQPPVPLELALSERDHGRQVSLDGNHLLVLNLTSNPSTGYGWEVANMNRNVLRPLGEAEFKPEQERLGAPVTQVLRFEAVAKGQTNIDLVYRRPWEKQAAPLKTFSVKVNASESYKGVRPVLDAAIGPAGLEKAPSKKPPKPTPTPPPSGDLPAAYDWCDLNGCTPVKDQGYCGSCWAFSTVGALESAIKISTGVSKDLSEQYLVSCNSDNWGCNGGWFAHDYHQWKYIFGEPGPGAVYESNFRYQAADVPCNPPHTHNEQIASWAFVGSSSSVPSVDAIKQAIYDHGPVSAAVCVDNAFQSYTGGVFKPRKSCRSVNHAIVLVGWDDSEGYWILRNSWGSSWGENGYMRIGYGIDKVGYGASYVVFP